MSTGKRRFERAWCFRNVRNCPPFDTAELSKRRNPPPLRWTQNSQQLKVFCRHFDFGVISGFRRDVDKIRALLGCYAASDTDGPLKMGQIRRPETSVRIYRSALRKITEECGSHFISACTIRFVGKRENGSSKVTDWYYSLPRRCQHSTVH